MAETYWDIFIKSGSIEDYLSFAPTGLICKTALPRKTKMTFNENGLILKEQNIGERDKLVTVLTANHGVLRAFVRGAKAVKSKKQSATSNFVMRSSRSIRAKTAT